MAEHTKERAAADQTLIIETPPQLDPKQPSDNASPSKDGAQHGGNRTKTFLVLVGIVFALAFLMYGAFLAGQKSVDVDRGRSFTMRSSNGDIELTPGQVGDNGNGTTDGYGPRGGMMRGGWDSDDTSTSTSSTRLSGVVTAVSGDTITVAGGGTTTKVTATSSTNYTGSSEPAKVNDSIVVFGTQNSDGSLTATSIRLVRN